MPPRSGLPPTLRCYLDGVLREAWDIAWEIVPFRQRGWLSRKIRSVTSEESLEDFTVHLADGTRQTHSEVAHGFCMVDPTDEYGRALIKLSGEICEVSEWYRVAVMLHEIAHALTVITYRGSDHDEVSLDRIEGAVWCQVASWALRDPSGYGGSETVAGHCIQRLADHADWLTLSD